MSSSAAFLKFFFFTRCFDMGCHWNPQIKSRELHSLKLNRTHDISCRILCAIPDIVCHSSPSYSSLLEWWEPAVCGQDDLWLRVKGNSAEWHKAFSCSQAWQNPPVKWCLHGRLQLQNGLTRLQLAALWAAVWRYFSYLTTIGNPRM